MSQYHFQNENYKVLYGWDDPLQYCFLVIYKVVETNPWTPVFSNMDLENPGMSIPQIKETLASYGIDSPNELAENLNHDETHSRQHYKHSLLQARINEFFDAQRNSEGNGH